MYKRQLQGAIANLSDLSANGLLFGAKILTTETAIKGVQTSLTTKITDITASYKILKTNIINLAAIVLSAKNLLNTTFNNALTTSNTLLDELTSAGLTTTTIVDKVNNVLTTVQAANTSISQNKTDILSLTGPVKSLASTYPMLGNIYTDFATAIEKTITGYVTTIAETATTLTTTKNDISTAAESTAGLASLKNTYTTLVSAPPQSPPDKTINATAMKLLSDLQAKKTTTTTAMATLSAKDKITDAANNTCLLYTSPSPRD